MPSHPPSHQVGAWKLLVTEVSPQPMKSESEKGPRGSKKQKQKQKQKQKLTKTGNAVRLAASSAVTSHPQSMLGKGIIQSDTAVCVYCGIMQSVICYLVHIVYVWSGSPLP